jgi:hypothetical protein
MAYKQTRRSISVSRGTYLRLKGYCEETNQSMSGVTTKAILAFLDEQGVPEPIDIEIKLKSDAPGPDDDFFVPVRDPKDHPEPKVTLPVESPEEFSKRFDKLREKNPYHVEVSRKPPPEPKVEPTKENGHGIFTF